MLLNRLVVLILFLIAMVCLFLWLNLKGNWSNLGLNGFTEVLGIIVTVLIVDQLIKRQEELRSLPQRATAYEDVCQLTSRLISFWEEVFRSCVPEPAPPSLAVLFSKESFEMMGRYLNLDSTPKKLPTQTWWQWFPEGFDDFKERADTILKWHNNILDPKVHRFVHFIATEGVDSEKILSLRQTNEMLGIPQPHILGNYWFLPNNYCETVLGLVEWSESQVKKLESHGMQNLKRVSEISNWEKQSNPPCMISDEEFAKQNAEEDEFRTKTSTSPI